jgi:hypothetical protein
MTRVELAEGKLLNEIHEHISLGITMALDALISASHAEGVAEERERIRGAAFGVFDDVGTAFLEGIRVIYIGKPIPIVEKGAAFVPASVLAPKEQP